MMNRDPFRQAAQRLNRAAPQGERVAYVNPAEENLLKAFGGSGRSVNGIPSYQPTMDDYGTAMRESLEAQLAMVTGKKVGTADYSDVIPRGMEDIIAAERPGRMAAAQAETDVLRQTLLGDQQRTDEQGRLQIDTKLVNEKGEPLDARYKYRGGKVLDLMNNTYVDPMASASVVGEGSDSDTLFYGEKGGLRFTEKGAKAMLEWSKEKGYDKNTYWTQGGSWTPGYNNRPISAGVKAGAKVGEVFSDVEGESGRVRGLPVELWTEFTTSAIPDQMNDHLDADGRTPVNAVRKPVYETDPNTGKSKIYTNARGEVLKNSPVREGTGMLDMFGPTESGAVTKQVTTGDERFEAFVNSNQNLRDRYAAESRKLADLGEPVPSVSEFGRDYYFNQGGKDRVEAGELEAVPSVGESYQVNRRAGFDPTTGEFLGLTTMGADASEQLARRQRAADIYDVEQLGQKATDAYRDQGDISGALATARGLGPGGTRPATAADVAAGRATTVGEGIAGPSAIPSDPLFSGDATPVGGLRGVAKKLGATTLDITGGRIGGGARAFDPMAKEDGAYARTREATQADVDVGRATSLGQTIAAGGTDPLRMALLEEAQSGLGQGLTARELRNIQEGTRAAATARGRVRDIGSVQAEVEARLLEDRQRQAMNRAFAAQTLGQEAGYQTSDLGRGMQAQLANLQTQQAGIGRELGAAESDIERATRQQAMAEQYRQAGLGQERAAAGQMVALEQATSADPFQAILQRPSGAGAQMGQKMFGAADYGLTAGPEYVAPQSGLSYISAQNAAEAGMYGSQLEASARKSAGKKSMIGSIIGGIFCWVAREAYGADNPKWLRFREWMLHRASDDLREYYVEHGPAIAESIRHDEPAKARMRGTMDAILEGS